MKSGCPVVVAVFLAAWCVPGCGPAFSDSVKYPVRQDPLALKGDKLDVETSRIDPPGQLPLMAVADLADPRHPLFAKHQQANLLHSEDLRDPKGLNDQDRQAIQDFLDEHFGTPAHPRAAVTFVNQQDVADPEKTTAFLETLQLERAALARGRDL